MASVFIIGGTGYIGSHVAKRLVADGNAVSALARTPEAAARLAAAGIRPALGAVRDHDVLRREARAADATIFAPQVSQEEEQDTVKVLLDALDDRGRTFIFTSGTGVLAQRTAGYWSEDSFAEDDEFTPLRQLLVRVETESLVRRAAQSGVRSMVIRPPAILGYGHNWHEAIVRESIKKTGAACYVGPGLSITTSVHIDDLADLYALVLDRGEPAAVYHSSAGEFTARTLAETVASECGCGTLSLSMDETIETLGRFEALMVLGVCSRSRSPRSRALGWSPRHLDLLEEVRGRGPAPEARRYQAF